MAFPSRAVAGGDRPSLYRQVRLARLWLPASIVGMVLAHQLLVLPLGGSTFQFWGQLLFYALLGPIVTFAVLDWIAASILEREQAQQELERLYGELSDSFELLGNLQRVTERFASAADLQMLVTAAVEGVRAATGANAALLLLRQGILACDPPLQEQADANVRLLETYAREIDKSNNRALAWSGSGYVLAQPLAWDGRPEGALYLHFASEPDPQVRETMAIIASEFAAAAEAVQSRTRDLITLFEVDRSIRAEGNLARLLDSLLVQMMQRVHAQSAGVFLVDEDNLLQLRSEVRAAGAPLASRSSTAPVRVGEGLIGRAVASGQPEVLDTLAGRLSDSGDSFLHDAGAAVLLPLQAGDATANPRAQAIGLVVLAHPDAHHFDAENLPFLALLANQVTLAVRNADAYLQAEELAITEERSRIAREIHDGVAQSLAFAALKLDLVARIVHQDAARAEAEVQQTKATIREMIREIRRSIFALRPVDLERFGLLETMRRYALDFGQQNDVRVELDLVPVEGLSLKTEAVLFRIFQEAMHNVAKHAAAKQVEVSMHPWGGGASLVIVDNGVGFDMGEVGDRVTTAGSLGLRQMRERVEGRGGHLEIASQKGAGTRVAARVPA